MAQITVCDRCGAPTAETGVAIRLVSPGLFSEEAPLVGTETFLRPPSVFVVSALVKGEGGDGLENLDLCKACLYEILRRLVQQSGLPAESA